MQNWNTELKISKKQPTDEELQQIEEELKDVNLKVEFNDGDLNTKVELTEEEIKEKIKTLSKKELKMIDEMVRIIEDPTYISYIRKRRLEEQDDSEVQAVSFEEPASISDYNYYHGEDSNY